MRGIKQACTRAGYTGSLIVLGIDAATAFLNSEEVHNAYNMFNYRPGGQIDPTDTELFGVSHLGSFWGMPIMSYEALYRDPFTNKMQYYMPADQILVASPEQENKLAYSEVVQVDMDDSTLVTSYRASWVPSYVKDPYEENIQYRLQARPVPIPVDMLS